MDKHTKKMLAPIIITVFLMLFLIVYGIIAFITGFVTIIGFLAGLFFFALSGVMLWVCIERIKEIRSGEEDDLSKY